MNRCAAQAAFVTTLCLTLVACAPVVPEVSASSPLTPAASQSAAALTPPKPLNAEELRTRTNGPGGTFQLYGSLIEDQVELTLDPTPSTPRLVIAMSCSAAKPAQQIMVTLKATQGNTELATLAMPCGHDTAQKLAAMEPALFTPGGEPIILKVLPSGEPSLRYTVAVLGST